MLTLCYALRVTGFSTGDTGLLRRRNSLKVSENTRWEAEGEKVKMG